MIVPCAACGSKNRVPAHRFGDRARCAACKGALLPLKAPVALEGVSDFVELMRQSALPVLVDFWAPWCGPCRVVAPELEKLAGMKSGALVVAKLNTDEFPELAGRYEIRSIPTFILFRGGEPVRRFSGAMPASQLATEIAA